MKLDKFNKFYTQIINEYIEESECDPQFNFQRADFSWNEDATSFKELNFTACDGNIEIKIDDFYKWLQNNFPEETKALYVLSRNIDWGGFEDYVVWSMQYCDTNDAGCYADSSTPILLFKNAKTI